MSVECYLFSFASMPQKNQPIRLYRKSIQCNITNTLGSLKSLAATELMKSEDPIFRLFTLIYALSGMKGKWLFIFLKLVPQGIAEEEGVFGVYQNPHPKSII